MVADLANQIWAAVTTVAPHPLLALAYTSLAPDDDAYPGIFPANLDISIPSCLHIDSPVLILLYVKIYVNYFIALVQGVFEYWCRIRDHVFHVIDKVFWNNAPVEPTR